MSAVPQLSAREWRGAAWITAAAAALYVVVRLLPTGTNLSHMDFRVQGTNTIEFCDPANPQFLPVVSVRSPVELSLATEAPAVAGSQVRATLVMTTFSGKPIAPEDLLLVHTRLIHLLIADPSLDDYQHVHPVPGRRAGTWTFTFRPRYGGTYRVFADFTPVATNRGLYAEAPLEVSGTPNPVEAGSQAPSWSADRAGLHFSLAPSAEPIRAGRPADLVFTLSSRSGAPVRLAPVMDVYAHLVAFDAARSGFAHIHPLESDPAWRPDPVHPRMTFRLMIPAPGRYVIWAEVDADGQVTFVPFWFDVSR